MTQGIQTLDSALQAIAAEREALKTGYSGQFTAAPSTPVPSPMPLPPIPKAPNLVSKLPQNLQSVARVDTSLNSNHTFQSQNSVKKNSKIGMVLGNIALSAVISVGSVMGVNMLQKKSGSGDMLAMAKSDLIATGKEGRISAIENARLNTSCTRLYLNSATGQTESLLCGSSLNRAASTRREVTQFSTENTSATINPKKFNESLSRSDNKISASLSQTQDGNGSEESGNQFSQTFSSSGSVSFNDVGLGDTEESGGLKLKPRGIVKKFYATSP